MTHTLIHDSSVPPAPEDSASNAGLRVPRRFTRPGIDPLDEVKWERRRTVITNPDGSVVFQMDGVEVPAGWSQLATDIVVSKYFRKAGVPAAPGHETSVRQVVQRLARTIRRAGEQQNGYFAAPEDADAFEAELAFMLVHQIGAFNSPVWFNCGLHHEYGIAGSGGNFAWNAATRAVETTTDSYSRPQVSACFIQSIDDDLMSIFELARNEARVFKFGSGSGTNFSKLRGRMEKLSGGGTSSGLMSFLEVLDKGAGATKSGGTTRRAAKMVVLDLDHPEIVDFIRWKVREEKKVAVLVASGYSSDFNGDAYGTVSGQNSNNSVRVPDRFMEAVVNDGVWETTFRTTGAVHERHRARELWREIAEAAWQCADPGIQYDDTIQKWHTCKATDRIHATNPCVTGDTMVATADGWQRIDSLVGSAVEVIGADGQAHPITGAFKTGRKPVYQLRTSAGYEVRITGNHKVSTQRGDVPAAELLPGDRVQLKGGGFGRHAIEKNIAFGIGSAARMDRARMEALVGVGGESEGLDETHGNNDSAPMFDMDLATELYGALVAFDYQGETQSLTDRVFELDRSSAAALLRGLFSGPEILLGGSAWIDSKSREFLLQIQKLLLGFGVKAELNGVPVNREILGQPIPLHFAPDEYPNYRLEIIDLRSLEEPFTTDHLDLTDRVASIEPLGEEDVFDLTEPVTEHFVANGIVVHNCSEFVFLDDTACNLSSINLMKFLRADGSFDVEGYRHANRVFFLAQEILVDFASYPTEKIAQRSHEFRPLGLGYANLGTLLMVQGLPYDSDAARAYSASITALMTGEAYALSAEMAASRGPFEGYRVNADSMLEVMRAHREAARAIDPTLAPRELRAAAVECWDRAVALGALHGYRNSQATVLAPTGCLAGHSLVATDRGLVPLDTLGNPDGEKWQDISVAVHTDEGPRMATKFFINGVAMTRRLKTACGYEIQGTPEHRIKVIDPQTGEMVWRRFSEIREDDQVPLALNTVLGTPRMVKLPPLEEMHWNGNFDTHVPPTITPELAELVGYFMGDGSVHSKGLRFCVSQQDEDVLKHLATRIRELFNLNARIEQREGYWEVAVNSVPLALWWEACGFVKHKPQENHTGKGYAPHIPTAILYTNNAEVYAAFLRGLYEADGTVTNGAPCWTSAKAGFSQQVKALLLAMGYPTTTKIDHSEWGDSDLFVLRLRNFTYNSRFLNEIGFISQRKGLAVQLARPHSGKRDFIPITADQLEELVPVGSPFRAASQLAHRRKGGISRDMARQVCDESGDERLEQATHFFYDRIVANEDGGEQLTYDLSVPSNVTYTAGGFISHNTIGLLMDCDTTGVEPDFALVKFKKLAGGGYFKIANQSVPAALRRLGYDDPTIERIVRYAIGTGRFEGTPHIHRASLQAKGLTPPEIDRIERVLPTMLDLRFAFTRGLVTDETLTRLGVSQAEREKPTFTVLPYLGFTDPEIEEANATVCGSLSVEGAPGLNPSHLPVFDCANRCGSKGTRFIEPMGHIRMMAAVQPFISGAISKTVNLPPDATVQDVEKTYFESWKLGIKAVALYRDGSKLSQPLATSGKTSESAPADTSAEPPPRLRRRRLPRRRHGFTQEARIAGHKVFLRTGEYEDGTLGEIFIDMHKEGAAFRSMMNCFAISVSMGLQYGVPLEDLVDQFTFTRFEPQGRVEGHDNIRACTSVVDYVFRVLGIEYCSRTDLAHIVTDDLIGKTVATTPPAAGGHATSHPVGREHPKQGNGKQRGDPPVSGANVEPGAKARVEPGAVEATPDALYGKMSGDAPLCNICGHVTVRNGTCYRCFNCGNSMGCS